MQQLIYEYPERLFKYFTCSVSSYSLLFITQIASCLAMTLRGTKQSVRLSLGKYVIYAAVDL